MLRSSVQRSKQAPKGPGPEVDEFRDNRLRALGPPHILENGSGEALGRLARIAADLFDVDVAFVALMDSNRQWLKEGVGLGQAESRLVTSLCRSTVKKDTLVVLRDAGEIDQVRTGALAQRSGLCFYAGVPIRTPAGKAIGTFAIMDAEPRSLSATGRNRLKDLGATATEEIRHQCEVRRHEQLGQKRKKRLQQFDAVFEDPDMLAGVLSPDGVLLDINGTALRRIEEGRDDVLGQLFWETPWWPDRIRSKMRKCVERAATGKSVEYDAELVNSENQVYNIEGTVRPVKRLDGTVTSLIVSARDVTERKKQKQLEEARAQLEALFEHSPDMISIHDVEGRLLRANLRFFHKTGYRRSDLRDAKIWNLLESINPRDATESWMEMEVGDRRRLEGMYRCKEGSTFPVEIHVRRLRLGGEDRFVVISRDITDRRRREQTIQAANDRYQTLARNFPNGGVFLFNEDLQYTLAGGNGLSDVGLSPSTVEGASPHDLFPEGLAEELSAYFRRALEGEKNVFEQEMGGRCYRNRTLPVRDEAGTPIAGMAVSQDITQEKEREQKLQQAETLLQNVQDALFLLDVGTENGEKTLAYQRINPVYEKKFGYAEDEIRGRSPESVYGEDPGQAMEAKCWECIRRQEPIEYEETVPLDGEETHWHTRLAPVIIDGEVRQVVGTTRDVTQQQWREEKLDRQNDLFDRAQKIANVGGWEYDVEADTVRWTPEVYRIHNYSTQKNPGDDDVISCYHPDDQPRLEQAFEDAVEEGVPYDLELRLRTEAGEERWVRARGEPQREDGEVVRLRGTIQEVTERKKRERILQERQVKIEALYEATNQLLQAEDEDDLSARLSSVVSEALGYPATTIRLVRGDELVPAHVPPTVQVHMPERPSYDIDGDFPAAEAYQSGETKAFEDLSAEIDTQDRGDIRATAYVPMGPHGLISVGSFEAGGIGPFDLRLLEVLAGYAALVLDRLEREQSLREAKAEAEEVSQMKSSLLANMSHEIRTPLTSVIGFAEAAGTAASNLDLPEENPLPRYTTLIERGGKRLLETLEGVLNLSKLEAGRMELSTEPIDLVAEAQQASEEFRPKAEGKDIDLRLGTDTAQARADTGGVQIVLRNLVTNAIKYTEEGGTVWIRTYRQKGQAVLEVEDTGIGMEPGQADGLFEPFRQASEGLSRQYEGTGVGLAVTKKATEQMNGTLEVETEKAEGSRFTVRLPAVQDNGAES